MTARSLWSQGWIILPIWLLLAFSIYRDFGITWDEPIQRNHGLVSMDYINDCLGGRLYDEPRVQESLLTYDWRFYGTAFQLVAISLEDLFGIEHRADIFYLRHILNIILFGIALFVFYRILLRRFSEPWLAYLGVIVLASSPRIFSHQFFNPKDAAFLSLYIFCIWGILRYVEDYKPYRLMIASALAGILIAMRVLGLIVPMILLVLLLSALLKREMSRADFLRSVGVLGIVSLGVATVCWPYLWSHPIGHLREALAIMSHYSWEGYMLLDGREIFAGKVPPIYIPRWISITTPVVYLLLLILGAVGMVRRVVYRWFADWRSPDLRADMAILGLWLSPLLAIIVLRSTVYDGWRHMHFIYPAMIYGAVWAVAQFRKYLPDHSAAIWSLLCVLPIVQLIQVHPYASSWFNVLTKKPWYQNYDMDYWGQGYLESYKIFSERHPEMEGQFVRAKNYPGWECYQAMPEEWQQKHPYQWDEKSSYYLITNLRYPHEVKRFDAREDPYIQLVDSITIRGEMIYALLYHPSSKDR